MWPIASFVCQQWVPLKLRVLWLNLVALGWSTFVIMQGRTLGSGSGLGSASGRQRIGSAAVAAMAAEVALRSL